MKAVVLFAAFALLAGCQSHNQTSQLSPERQLATVNQLLAVRAVDQVSPTQWRFTLKYKGNRPIGELDFTGHLYQGDVLLTEVNAHPDMRFLPGSNYYVITQAQTEIPMGTQITSYDLEARHVHIY